MKQLVVIICLVVTMVAAVRKEVINIFFTKISVIQIFVKITILINIFFTNIFKISTT